MFLEYTWKCFKITKINYFVWIIMLLKEITTKEFDKGGKGAATLLFDFPTDFAPNVDFLFVFFK